MEVELPRLVAAVTSGDIQAKCGEREWPLAWKTGDSAFGEAPLRVGACFEELIDGVASLQALATAHGATMWLWLCEAPAGHIDPFIELRPSTPALERFDVVVERLGTNLPALASKARTPLRSR